MYIRNKIHINQLGYVSSLKKEAAVIGGRGSFEIINAITNKTMFVGKLSKSTFDKASGENVSIADFSMFELNGRYYLKKGLRRSKPFVISNRPYCNIKNALLNSFYCNRCSETSSDIAGDFAHVKCHSSPAKHFENHEISGDYTGGWHNSGGYSKFSTFTAISLANMLYTYSLFSSLFSISKNIYEDNNNKLDLIAECKYGLEWLLKMQGKNGGVYNNVSPLHSDYDLFPTKDAAQQFLFPVTHRATANFVAVTALASRIFKEIDAEFSETLSEAAFNGWWWICENPEIIPEQNLFTQPVAAFDTYQDTDFNDDYFWAVCELYALTGDSCFAENIEEKYKIVNVAKYSFKEVGGYGALAYMTCKYAKNSDIIRHIHLTHRIESDNLIAISNNSMYKTTLEHDDYQLGSNHFIMNNAITLLFSYIYLKTDICLDLLIEQLNYVLGKNPCGISYITGFGSNSVLLPHHRACAFDNIEKPIPGLLVFGPCQDRSDGYMFWNTSETTPPAKCYKDNGNAFSVNDTHIMGSSAALMITAFLDSYENYKPNNFSTDF